MDKENLVEEEIAARLSRVKKVEMAPLIKCSYGTPDINYFRENESIYHQSLTFKNPAYHVPKLEDARNHFVGSASGDIQTYLKLMENDYWSV